MELITIIEYATCTSTVVWLAWLASRPFLVKVNRLLFMVFGLLAYGFFANNLVIPMTGIQTAYLEASREMAKLGKQSSQQSIFQLDELTIRYFLFIGVLLVVFFLLTLWLQRTLARCPSRAPSS